MLSLTELVERQIAWIKHNSRIQPLLFILSWLSVWLLAYIVEYVNHASVWFPAAGLTFAGLLVVGARLIPALTICAVVSTLWTGYLYQLDMSIGELFFPGVVFAITHIIPYFLATTILRKYASQQVHQLPSLMIVFLVIAVISSLVTAFSVIYGLVFTGLMSVDDVSHTWLAFWVGDMAGIIAVSPIFVGIIAKIYPQSQFWIGELKSISNVNSSDKYVLKLLLGAAVLLGIMLLVYLYPSQESNLAIFVMILPVMWISYTESPVRTAFSIALFSLSVAFLVNILSLMEFVIVYQFAICIVAASAYFYLTVPSLVAHNQELRKKTITDHLTGAASREHLISQADVDIAKAHCNEKPLALIVFDLDYFKSINDTLGHAHGDEVLTEVTKVVKGCIRPTDLLSRFGGDEFVVLMPDTGLDEAKNVADRILAQVRTVELCDGKELTCSLGACQLMAGEEFRQIFDRADKALYRAKNDGRNQVQISPCNAIA